MAEDGGATVPDAVTATLGHRPGKVVAVHLNYPSRAAQRGRTPTAASYFLKPSSSLSGGGSVERPLGTELLAFEGEIALVIARPARHVRPEDGWAHVGWVTAANDLGLHDLRTADRGSNVRSKGGDGFTPLGPTLLAAAELDPAGLRVRTWLDGVLVQEDTSDTQLFDFGHLVADLSRTAHAGAWRRRADRNPRRCVGRAAGAGGRGGGRHGRRHPQHRAAAHDRRRRAAARRVGFTGAGRRRRPGGRVGRGPEPPALSDATRERLGHVAVATLSALLRKRGFPDTSIDGVRALVPGRGLVGTARTLRFVPFRPDLFASHAGGLNAQKRAMDTLRPGEVLVIESRRDPAAGTLGDILALRAKVRGAAGIVTDGAVRDAAAVAATGLPVFAAGPHPAVLGRRHVPWETDVTIGCGGATVQVGDVVVADDDGALVIPRHLVEEVLDAAERQEREEAWIVARVAEGAALDGLYPLAGAWRERFDAERDAETNAERRRGAAVVSLARQRKGGTA